MKAAVVLVAGQSPSYADFPDPVADEGEEIVTVTAAALTNVSRGRAMGAHYSSGGGFPLIPGVEGAGRLSDGKRVLFFMPRAPYGSFADKAVIPAGMCVPLPDDLDDVTAAAIANPGVSSWGALTERTHFRPGQTVLVNGATGTSGLLAVQIAKRVGAARVVATGRNREALARLTTLGADAVVPLVDDDDTLEQSLKQQFAEGVDVVLDYLWGRPARIALIAAARAGAEQPIRFVSIGSVAGAELELPSAVLRSSQIELVGSGLGSVSIDRLIGSIGALLEAAGSDRLKIETRPVALADIGSVWAARDDRRRVVLIPGGAGV